MVRDMDKDTVRFCKDDSSKIAERKWLLLSIHNFFNVYNLVSFIAGGLTAYFVFAPSLIGYSPLYEKEIPQQLHLSLGSNDSEYYVTWSTLIPARTYLEWCDEPCTNPKQTEGQLIQGVFESKRDEGRKYTKYSYRAKMSVVSGKDYSYKVSVLVKLPDGKGAMLYPDMEYKFKAKAFDDPSRSLKVIFYGDLGLKNAQSVPRLTKEIEENDLIIHNGDFAYDLDTEDGHYGDKFMQMLEPIAARIPYQTSVGNHEIHGNFSEYNHRFTMINRGAINHGMLNNFFYSFNAGPVHFVAISTEFYYFLNYVGIPSLVNQYNWLVSDLQFASSAAERSKRPWIVVFGHRPMYCSSRDRDDCSKDTNLLRRGLPFTGAYALEKLFYQYGVDVELYSHEHQYERFLPIYDGKVYNGTDKPEQPYYNPRAPVHLISGSAGCQEKLDPFEGHPATGSVKQISDYGFTRIVATQESLSFEQISDDKAGDIVDKFVIIKNKQNFPQQLSAQDYSKE